MQTNYRAGQPGVFGLGRVRALRRESTDAERVLWGIIRDRQLSGAKFRRQHRFGPYVLDFYCAERQLAIEADGGQHLEPEGLMHDDVRTRYLEAHGISVVRFFDGDILTNREGVAARIMEALEDQPSPQPSPRGRGG